MTKIWDTGIDQGAVGSFAFGEESNRAICWCEDNALYSIIYIREAVGVTYFCYAHGNDNAWTEEILVRSDNNTGRLGIQALVDGFGLDVHQTGGANDHVHIAWAAGGIIYHSELIVPNTPNNNANWTAWGGLRYQRVDNNAAMIGYYAPSIQVDNAGDPHITYGNSAASELVCYNYGPGAGHVINAGAELNLSGGGIINVVNPTIIAIPEVVAGGRDLYVFWLSANTVQYRYCASAGPPLNIGSWAAAVTIITTNTAVAAVSAAYFYDPGGSLAQIMVGAYDSGLGLSGLKTNRYDEGNVYGWGGGWRAAPNGTLENRIVAKMQITQVDSNDFALTQVIGGVGQFSYTDIPGGGIHDFIGQTVYDFTNSAVVEIAAEMRGRENGDFSQGVLHTQAGGTWDYMFDLVRINASPVTSAWDPDAGDREDEAAIITLSWTFTDPGQAQTKRRVQVDTFGGGFGAPVYDSGEQVGAAHNWDVPALTLVFNTHYEWRVKVWDDEVGDEYDPYSEGAWEG